MPNITGGIESTNGSGYQFLADKLTATSGAFSVTGSGAKLGISADSTQSWGYEGFYLDASKSNSIYGKSNTVQPPALVVNIWKRTE